MNLLLKTIAKIGKGSYLPGALLILVMILGESC